MTYCIKREAMEKASYLALGARYAGLLNIIEGQKTISTSKLERYVDMLIESDKLTAILLRDLAVELNKDT